MAQQPQIIYRKRSFWSQAALGISLVMITLTISGTIILLYGMYIVNDKTDNMVGIVQSAFKSLPEVRKSLPPVLADVLNDRRRIDYRRSIEVNAKSVAARGDDAMEIHVAVTNKGDALVSLLAFRLSAFDENGNFLFSRHVYGVTPFAADEDWPGPLMPGACRHLSAGPFRMGRQAVRVETEISDLRVWEPDEDAPQPEGLPAIEKPEPPAVQRARL